MDAASSERSFKWLLSLTTAQLLVAVQLAINSPPGWHIVTGLFFGQATLLGIWLAAARTGRLTADIFALTSAIVLALALASRGGGWTLILLVARIIVAVAFYRIRFVRRGIRLALQGEPLSKHLLRVPLRLLLAASILTALFFGLASVLSDGGVGGPFGQLLLILLIALLGVGNAAMAIWASLVALEPRLTLAKLAVYAVVLVGFAAMFGGITYWQTNSTDGAITFGLTSLLESAWIAGSLALARLAGLNLRHVAIGE